MLVHVCHDARNGNLLLRKLVLGDEANVVPLVGMRLPECVMESNPADLEWGLRVDSLGTMVTGTYEFTVTP